LAANRRGQIQFYQTFQPLSDPAILSPPHQSSYSGGARSDSPWSSSIQSDQPHGQQVEISTRGQHLRQEVRDQEVRRSLNRLLGSTIHREYQAGPYRPANTANQQPFSVPTVRRHQQVQDYQHQEIKPEEFRLADESYNAPVPG